MSRIYVDEVIASGLTQVNFPQGIKIAATKTIDLSESAINLTSGIGINGQVLTSTGAGVVWSTRDNTDTTYTFAGRGLAVNDVKLDLTAGGSGSGIQTITFTGTGRTDDPGVPQELGSIITGFTKPTQFFNSRRPSGGQLYPRGNQ